MKHDWKYKKLGDICDKGSSNISLNKIEDNIGEYALFGASGYVKDIDFYHNETPYIGIVKDGSGCGRVNIYPAKSSLVGTMQYIYPKQNCDIKFLMYLLQSLDLSSLVTGAAIPHIYFKDYSKFSVPLPPLSTQQSIVSELDSLSKIIADCKETLKDYDALEQSIFYDMFGDPVKNEKKWEVKKLGEIVTLSQGLAINSQTNKLIVEKSSIPLLRIKDMREGTREIFIDDKNYPPACLATPDDIIYTRTGTLGLVFTGMYGIVHNNCFKVKLDKEVLNKVFFMKFVEIPMFKNNIIALSSRSSQPDITHKLFNAQNIILPPLSLQQTFASKIEAIEQMKVETKKALQEAETLFQARMDYWFN